MKKYGLFVIFGLCLCACEGVKKDTESVKTVTVKEVVEPSDSVEEVSEEIPVLTDNARQPQTRPVKAPEVSIMPRFLKQNAPQEEVFSLLPNKVNYITCLYGTRIEVPKNAFTFQDGSPVTTPVTLKIKEFYNKSDYILSGLATQSAEGMLESGGMLNIEAYAEGKPLQLAEDKTIGLAMPRQNTEVASSNEMFLFASNEPDPHTPPTNWQQTPTPMPSDVSYAPPSLRFHQGGPSSILNYYRGEWEMPYYQIEFVDVDAYSLGKDISHLPQSRPTRPRKMTDSKGFEDVMTSCDDFDLPQTPADYEKDGDKFTVNRVTTTTSYSSFGEPIFENYDTVHFILDVQADRYLGNWSQSIRIIKVLDGYGKGLDLPLKDVSITKKGEFQFVPRSIPGIENVEYGPRARYQRISLKNDTFSSRPNKPLAKYLLEVGKAWRQHQRLQKMKENVVELEKEPKYAGIVFYAVIKTTKYKRRLRVMDQIKDYHYLIISDKDRIKYLAKEHSIYRQFEQPWHWTSNYNNNRRIDNGDLLLDFRYTAGKSIGDAYLAQVGTLGWINCDRFYKIPEEQKANLFVQARAPVRMIFENINAVLQGAESEENNWSFENVPKDASVILFSLEEEQGELWLALRKTSIGEPQTPLEYESVTKEELKSRLRLLDQGEVVALAE